jgi:hypothetical protein
VTTFNRTFDRPNDSIHEQCTVCAAVIEVPNKGLGRATLAAWRTRHQPREDQKVAS